MTGYEHEIKGTIIVNASDPAVGSKARYMVAKVINGEVWYYASFDDLETAKNVVDVNGESIPSFIIDTVVP